jgi:uncharacterized NAD(P)/FAD-binding protein YdhS
MSERRTLAVIGGGASAALLLANLARTEGAARFDITVFDREDRFGRGVAYSTTCIKHLLNVRAANMSAFPDIKEDFAIWAGARGYAPSDFVPRWHYGDYLLERMEEAKKSLSIAFEAADVTGAVKEGGAYMIETGGRRLPFDRCVLATGNVRPLSPKVDGVAAGYHSEPWVADYHHLSGKSEIALIGSGLSAVDAIVALQEAEHKGRITVFSRGGLFPAVHTDPVSCAPFLTDEDYGRGPASLCRRIRDQAEKAASQGLPWQAVIDSLRADTNAIWQAWDERQKNLFMKRFLTFWNVHRHRMAPEIAACVQRAQEEGRLRVVRDSIREVRGGPVIIGRKGEYRADAVINCLGYRYDEAGRDFDADFRIGPAAFGPLFETTAIPEIRVQAKQIVEALTSV